MVPVYGTSVLELVKIYWISSLSLHFASDRLSVEDHIENNFQT